MGQDYTLTPVAGSVHLGLSESPLYIHGEVGRLVASSPFAVTIPAEACCTDDLTVTATAPRDTIQPDHSADKAALSFAIGPAKTPFSAEGKATITLAPATDPGERWTPCQILQGEQLLFYGAALTQLRDPVVFAEFPHYTGPRTISVTLRNPSLTHPVVIESGSLALAGQPIVLAAATIAPQATETLTIPVPQTAPWTLQNAALELTANRRTALKWTGEISCNPVVQRTVKIDGDLADWADIPAVDLAKSPYRQLLAPLANDADLSGTLQLCWDNKYLYFAARIIDDIFSQPHTGYNVWKGDNIQLGVSTSPPWIGGDGSRAGIHELGLSLTANGPEFYRFTGPGPGGVLKDVSLVVKREASVTIYECAIPWTQIYTKGQNPGAGSTISFGAYVNDSDGHGRKGYRQWPISRPSSNSSPACS